MTRDGSHQVKYKEVLTMFESFRTLNILKLFEYKIP
uniref:Uncharacterized protein n=1 Tax=Arundo donax TaxID=35708 RepID=A0A0A9FSY9_ARUDO